MGMYKSTWILFFFSDVLFPNENTFLLFLDGGAAIPMA
jgi:hypothetical protein